MLVATPLFKNNVAPRFMVATEFAIAHISDGKVEKLPNATITDDGWHSRMTALRDLGVKLLLCGGFNRQFEPFAESLDIKVIMGLVGDVSDLFTAYAAGEDLPFACGCQESQGCGQERRRSRQRKNLP